MSCCISYSIVGNSPVCISGSNYFGWEERANFSAVVYL